MARVSFKDDLYRQYVTTHVREAPRTREALRLQATVFEQHFGKLLPTASSARIADLGCGSGALIWWLTQRGYHDVHGVDISDEQIAIARDLNIHNVLEGDVFDFLSKHDGFDLLFVRDLLEHLDKEDVLDFLRRCHHSLTVGGVIVLQVPNAESPYFGRVRYGDFTHELAFTRSSLTQLLGAAGFSETRVLPWRPGVTGIRSALRYFAWLLMEPLLKLPMAIESGGRGRIVTMNVIATATRTG